MITARIITLVNTVCFRAVTAILAAAAPTIDDPISKIT